MKDRNVLIPVRGRSGFTLVELLVAIGLSGVVLAILVGFFSGVTRTSTVQNAVASAQQTARVGLDFIVQEVRLTGLDPLKSAGAGIEEITASGDKLRFTLDRCDRPIGGGANCPTPEPDGDVEDTSERVTFLYDAQRRELRHCLYEGTDHETCQALIDEVVPNPPAPDGTPIPLFAFLNDAGARVSQNDQRAEIRTVVVTLTVREPAGPRGTVERTYASRVRLRNLGL